MSQVTLTVHSPDGTAQVPVEKDRFIIGRSESVDLHINDPGLSRQHASVNRDNERIWILDEGSTNCSYVNGKVVPSVGKMLADGDKINMGDYTTLWVSITNSNSHQVAQARPAARTPVRKAKTSSFALSGIALAALVICLLVGAAAFTLRVLEKEDPTKTNSNERTNSERTDSERTASEGAGSIETPPPSQTQKHSPVSPPKPIPSGTSQKLYLDMADQEKTEYVRREAAAISSLIGSRPCAFTSEVMAMIKRDVDGYARRKGSNPKSQWGSSLDQLLDRGVRYAPFIIRSFNQEGVKPIIGLYIAMIESEFQNICRENFAHAAGMFQFIPGTAIDYGVAPSDRCDEKKLAPAAAKYMRDRIATFGTDATSVALSIAAYNRSPSSVKRDLHTVLDNKNPERRERSFWTLVANSQELDHWFQENMKYVPKFFAAAIVGENPEMFGLRINALSTYSAETQH